MEADEPALTRRQERILRTVCRDYIIAGTEVSSAGLVRAHGITWSTATIRQELAALEQLGYLQRPHRSAGCLPTREGMRRYVADLPKDRRPDPALAGAVDRILAGPGPRPERDLKGVSYLLAEVAGCIAVSFWATPRDAEIVDIDVVPLVGDRALVVMSLADRTAVSQPVHLRALAQTPDDFGRTLLRLQEHLRALCRGRTLPRARVELARVQEELHRRFDRILAEALRVGMTLCAGAALDPLVVEVAGQPRLARDQVGRGPVPEVLELLEDVRRLADVLCQLLPAPAQDAPPVADVRVGVEGLAGVPAELTLVGARLLSPSHAQTRATGAVALLGSDRMDYAAVIPLVEYAARTLAAH